MQTGVNLRITLPAWALLYVTAFLAHANHLEPTGPTMRFDELREEWVPVEEEPPGTAAGDLSRVRRAFAAERYDEAHRLIRQWRRVYPADDLLAAEASILLARIEISRKNYDRAHKVLQAFLNELPSIELLDEALHYEFIIAEAYLKGARREFLWMKILPGEDRGLEILDDIALNYPESSAAELAVKAKADHLMLKGEHSLAELDYSRLQQDFPRSRYVRYAARKTADAALASFAGVEYDDAPLIEAEDRYNRYLAQLPPSPEREEISLILQSVYNKRAEKELEIGRYYERARRPRAAAFYYRSTAKNWPDTQSAAKALERLLVLGFPVEPEPSLPPEPASEPGEDSSPPPLPDPETPIEIG